MSFQKGANCQLGFQLKKTSQRARARDLACLIQLVKLQRLCPIPSVVLLSPPHMPHLPPFPQAHPELSLLEKRHPILTHPIPSHSLLFSAVIIPPPCGISSLLCSRSKRSPSLVPRMVAWPGLRGLVAVTSCACSQRYLSSFITVTSEPFGNLPKMYLWNYCSCSEEKRAEALL